ncbi:hypothetical protein JAAARDRAFT_121841 [Jaapia argillacea MUCL 33604]|uniref:DUF323 domain-containing protein n=1 Tax=Jaapia argillacea MUCL 33604 TaxID=933084 RepID=A0A067QGN1_9AGAM|nr:hypothetical protein JAAARDRAFT_121841 [Jaapia argillacea MUCL 33604]
MVAKIVDIRARGDSRRVKAENDIINHILAGLSKPSGQRTLPTLLLYDERGLRLYDDITTEAPEYYLFSAEEEILKNNANEIVGAMHCGATPVAGTEEVVLELGAGALRKTSHVLSALSNLVPAPASSPPITYYALDLEERELQRTLGELAVSNIGCTLKGKVETRGMLGTFDDGIRFVEEGGLRQQDCLQQLSPTGMYKLENMVRERSSGSTTSASSTEGDSSASDEMTAPSTPESTMPPLHILFLGSSLGNFGRGEGAEFLRSLPLRAGSGDTLLLGLDHDNDPGKIEVAYNDPTGHTRNFIMNGLKAAGRAMGCEGMFDESKWEYVNRYDHEARRHEAFYKSKTDQSLSIPPTGQHISFLADELIHVESSYKFSDVDAYTLFSEANLRPVHRWTDSRSQYSLWLLERPPFSFPLLRSPSTASTTSPFGLPTIQDWQDMWAAWDFVTRRMIPQSMLFQKPIDLRHICLFYFGHIPTFLDIHLSRLLKEPHTEPDEFKFIFERGIDPNVDDPTQCHSHSEVPKSDEDWPSLASILDFQSRVRARVMKLYADVDAGRVVMTRKIARVLFMTLEHEGFHIETLLYMLLQRAGAGTLPPSGFIPPPWSALSASWDAAPKPTEKTVTLGPAVVTLGHDDFEAEDVDPVKGLDVAGHAFGWDNEHPKREVHVDQFRIDWRPVTNGEFYEFYSGDGKGKVQFPASWVEVDGAIQVRTLYGPIPMKHAWNWPIITSYNNLSTYATVQGGRLPTEQELRLFLDKFQCGFEGGANHGFRNWHPVPATTGLAQNAGKGDNGGVWEWTSTVFEPHDGFIPSKLYPGYSLDFFDQCHNTVIGGSYATIPRLAERRTVRNYYQRNYPYTWAGARIAYDIQK